MDLMMGPGSCTIWVCIWLHCMPARDPEAPATEGG